MKWLQKTPLRFRSFYRARARARNRRQKEEQEQLETQLLAIHTYSIDTHLDDSAADLVGRGGCSGGECRG